MIPQRRFHLLTPRHNEITRSNTRCVLAQHLVQRRWLHSVKKLGLLAFDYAILRDSPSPHFAVRVPNFPEHGANKNDPTFLTGL